MRRTFRVTQTATFTFEPLDLFPVGLKAKDSDPDLELLERDLELMPLPDPRELFEDSDPDDGSVAYTIEEIPPAQVGKESG